MEEIMTLILDEVIISDRHMSDGQMYEQFYGQNFRNSSSTMKKLG